MFFSKFKKKVPVEDPNEYKVLDLIPDKMPRECNGIVLDQSKTRIKYQDSGMYGFVSWKWVNPFVEWLGDRKVLEVMAGRGWLSKALRDKEVDVIATDDYSWHESEGWDDPLTNVDRLDAVKSIEVYGEEIDILIMSWPYMDETAYLVI